MSDQVTEMAPAVFPWLRFLPAAEALAFQAELAGVQSRDDLAQVVTAWCHTAEVYADPELLAVLGRDSGDFGPVPPPAE